MIEHTIEHDGAGRGGAALPGDDRKRERREEEKTIERSVF